MEKEENQTDDTQVSESQLNSETGDEAVSNADALTLSEINEITGKQYKDKSTALKSLKDMSSQAGKAADLEGKLKKAESEPSSTEDEIKALKEQIAQNQTDMFFAENPDHKSNRELLEALAVKHGVSVREAADLDSYKSLQESLKAGKEAQSKRTVADSNKRVSSDTKEEERYKEAIGDRQKAASYVTEKFFSN